MFFVRFQSIFHLISQCPCLIVKKYETDHYQYIHSIIDKMYGPSHEYN